MEKAIVALPWAKWLLPASISKWWSDIRVVWNALGLDIPTVILATPTSVWVILALHTGDWVALSLGYTGWRQKVPWETLSQRLSRPISANPWLWSGYEKREKQASSLTYTPLYNTQKEIIDWPFGWKAKQYRGFFPCHFFTVRVKLRG